MTDTARLLAAVTGASRGIGRATAISLSRQGYRVFALARSAADLENLAREAAGEGHDIVPVVLDVASEGSRDQAVTVIMEATAGYGLDVVVNNAGYGQFGPLEEVSAEKLRRQLEVNVVSVLAFTQPFLPGMRQRRQGSIVNVSSAAGRIATPFMGAYSASKFALEALSDSLRLELAPFGVHVILIEPGPIPTQFNDASERETDPASPYAPFQLRWHAFRNGSDIFGRSAEDVGMLIVRAVQAPRPRARYTITLSAKMGTVMRRILPDIVLDWIFRRAMGSGS